MADREFVLGVYLLKDHAPNEAPVVWFDGVHFWLPGWECGLTPTDRDSDTRINVDRIGDLIWKEPDA